MGGQWCHLETRVQRKGSQARLCWLSGLLSLLPNILSQLSPFLTICPHGLHPLNHLVYQTVSPPVKLNKTKNLEIRQTHCAETYTFYSGSETNNNRSESPSCYLWDPGARVRSIVQGSRKTTPWEHLRVEGSWHLVNLTNVTLLWLSEIVSFLLSCIIFKVILGTISSSQFFTWKYYELKARLHHRFKGDT